MPSREKVLKETPSFHLVGIAGTGMSALAEALLDSGAEVSGSDRFLDGGESVGVLSVLKGQGVELFPQDGSGVRKNIRPGFHVVASSAVENDNPDVVAARTQGVPVLGRAEALARLFGGRRLVAVAGTCGKSTTTAMLGHILSASGSSPTVVNGAPCPAWTSGGTRTGAVLRGDGPLCVAEVDESDKSLLLFRPSAAIVLNASADHFPIDETNALFDEFIAHVQPGGALVDMRGAPPIEAHEGDWSVSFSFGRIEVSIPCPGLHNAIDATAAIRMAAALGVPPEVAARALSTFPGVSRRMQLVGRRPGGPRVVDDYAHNTEKLRSSLQALIARSRRVFAIWRPHGFAPLRKMRPDLALMFAETLRPDDRLLLLPVFDAGGTADRSISSRDLASDLAALGVFAELPETCEDAARIVLGQAGFDDIVAVFGARDPALPRLAEFLAS